jgi:hypothetical protein
MEKEHILGAMEDPIKANIKTIKSTVMVFINGIQN